MSADRERLKKLLRDRWWRLNNLYWIIDEKAQKVLFRLNNVQKNLYNSLWYLNIILKSRQHGVTTFFCIYQLDVALFNSNVRCGIIAHNREDAESFFKDKIKFAYDNLPEWLKNMRQARTDSARELSFSNNSAIRVGTSMRSATLQYLHISEFGKICKKYPEKAKEIVTGSLNTVHVGQNVSIESTAEGNSGYFYDYCQDSQKRSMLATPLTELDFKFHFFPWFKDPRNQLQSDSVVIETPLEQYFNELLVKYKINLTNAQKYWYAKKWNVQGPEMRREHPSTPEEAFEAAIEGAFFVQEFLSVYSQNRITEVRHEKGVPVETWWDLGMRDFMSIWFTQTINDQIRLIDFHQDRDRGLKHYAQMLRDKPYIYQAHWAPHDIKVRELGTGVSRLERARDFGLEFKVADRLSNEDQIDAARDVFRYCWFDEQKCSEGIRSLENFRHEWDEKLGTYKPNYLHDWASHAAKAFMVMAVVHPLNSGSVKRGLDLDLDRCFR